MPNLTQHTIAVERAGQIAALKRRVYRLTVGRGRNAVSHRLIDDVATLGSHEGNTVVVTDPTVSRFHARLELDRLGYLLTDLDSRNGTVVGGLRVKAAYLEPRAKVQLGDAEVRFDVDREEAELPLGRANRFGALWGASPVMRRLYEQLERVASSDATVLIQGESGSGKELAAMEIHQRSRRAKKSFVVVDCGGLPETLIESELFGHEKGAFTGADHSRPGAFEQADGGTLFLDEIGELGIDVQAKLLRAIDSRKVKRVGSETYRTIDVRFVAATHRDLARMCNQKLFREDLFYRLAVITVRVPPLRERLEDLPLLVQAILEEEGASGRFLVEEEWMNSLRVQRWSGNVRELRNAVQRAVVLGTDTTPDSAFEPYKVAKAKILESFERRYLDELLARCRGNIAEAARLAGVDRVWVHRLVNRHAIDIEKVRRPVDKP